MSTYIQGEESRVWAQMDWEVEVEGQQGPGCPASLYFEEVKAFRERHEVTSTAEGVHVAK